ncbi:MAG: ATP-dependent RNA helicase HrpA [Actinomycetota bacterium]
MRAAEPDGAAAPSIGEVRRRLRDLTVRDAHELRRRLDRSGSVDAEILERLERAEAHVAERRASVPRLSYPAELPISERRDDLLQVLREHQVVVVAGETGSGKSTQLPKLCLESGRGVRGMIGHTQPRRLAARSVAERIASEVGVELGGAVGYSVRFNDRVGDDTLVKVMTDGILLAEIQHDPMLRRYDSIIIDEAHERSLNIDFLLGYLHRLLPRRRDLQVVVTSATIDTERFAEHFDAPVVEVTGRTYPVEVRYQPFGIDDDRDQVQAIGDAVTELWTEGSGDVLVFCSGEREIHDAADHLRRMELPNTEILPLYARLSANEQHRIFRPHRGRRVIVSTNVAETSLTVPGIEYVVDTGTARISRYSRRLKVQRLPIEPISQASADQRAGRCGRIAPGTCIRLYDEEDFEARPEFTEPEILRTNLASVVLQMAALKLGEVGDFPFVDPPDGRAVTDAVRLLEELGAFDPGERDPRRRITRLGRTLARLPLDPRLGRMVVEAADEGCTREVLIIATALSIQDPRERPSDRAGEAAELHRRFDVDGSDFLAFLRLWDHLRERQRSLSGNQFRKLCKAEHLHYLRIREWQDLERQLRRVVSDLGLRGSSAPDDHDAIHRSLLAGLLSQIGMLDTEQRDYRGARNARFSLGRGSPLANQRPKWVMVGELVETNRLWGRVAAPIAPEWAERLGAHLVKRSYGDPTWDPKRGRAVAAERVTLYGLPIVAARTIGYDRVDPGLARDLFIQHALVEGETEVPHRQVDANRELFLELRARADRARRGQHLVPDEALFDFYDRRVGDEVASQGDFDRWWRDHGGADSDLLRLTEQDLLDPDDDLDSDDYPDVWVQGDVALQMTYEFDPGSPTDGATVHVPLEALNQVTDAGFDWQVPGLRDELVVAWLRSLPKVVRRRLLPMADRAEEFRRFATPDDGPLLAALGRYVASVTGATVGPDDWRPDQVPDHLLVTFSVDRDDGTALRSKDLETLRDELRGDVRTALSQSAGGIERTGLTDWAIGKLPPTVEADRGGRTMVGYPALVDEGSSVGVAVFDDPLSQAASMRIGTRRLLLLNLPAPRKAVASLLDRTTQLQLARGVTGRLTDLLDDAVAVSLDALVEERGGPAWDEEGFERLLAAVRPDVVERAVDLLVTAAPALDSASRFREQLAALSDPLIAPSVVDLEGQLERLTGAGFLARAGTDHLPHLPRYLAAVEHRVDRLRTAPRRDLEHVTELAGLMAEIDRAAASLPRERAGEIERIRWMVEELRVSTFAQQLGTAHPVSAKRIRRALADVVAGERG